MNSHFISEIKNKIFGALDEAAFEAAALQIFRFQFNENSVYSQYCSLIGKGPEKVHKITDIPFLPISLFKTQKILCGEDYKLKFTSSGTTGNAQSVHYVADEDIYRKSIERCFVNIFGDPAQYQFFALLPNYLERQGSSLIYMLQYLMLLSKQQQGHFHLYDHEVLQEGLQECLDAGKKKPFLVGVSFALQDFAENCPMDLSAAIVLETGGMKGRRKEITREELHKELKSAFNISAIHSEYGMTELLSQAYSVGEGLFSCPPRMRVYAREPRDPLSLLSSGKGAMNIIDLANLHSCSFIATDDLCEVFSNGSFLVRGRLDDSDIRGCNLMVE